MLWGMVATCMSALLTMRMRMPHVWAMSCPRGLSERLRPELALSVVSKAW